MRYCLTDVLFPIFVVSHPYSSWVLTSSLPRMLSALTIPAAAALPPPALLRGAQLWCSPFSCCYSCLQSITIRVSQVRHCTRIHRRSIDPTIGNVQVSVWEMPPQGKWRVVTSAEKLPAAYSELVFKTEALYKGVSNEWPDRNLRKDMKRPVTNGRHEKEMSDSVSVRVGKTGWCLLECRQRLSFHHVLNVHTDWPQIPF